jgi:acyl-CoA oxidase
MKFWIGATANLANMTVVFAQLYIGDKHHGPHAFVVPIRNKKNHNVLPGITIGDCGLKNGCNGIDNGFLIFKNVRIPRDNLLDRFSSVTSDGE